MTDTAKKIAALNDRLRTTFDTNAGLVVLTSGIQALPKENKNAIINLVKTFNKFTADNDPYEEHDFGTVVHEGRKAFFKIDYYDPSMTKGSENPADPEKTTRVMTIMLANEY